MIDQSTLEGKVLKAALDLAASKSWNDVSLRDIADAADVTLADLMERFEDKADVLKAFVELVDREMLKAAADVEREQTPRDALFEVIMSRFDLMAPYKAALRSIIGERSTAFPSDPVLVRLALRTQHRMMQAAGINVAGAPALLRQLGLARVYGQVFRIWLDDDDAGLARTMAALDKRLRQGEQTLRTIDDVSKSVDRMCAEANNFAARIIAGLRSAATPRPAGNGGPEADTSPPEAGAFRPDAGSDDPSGGAPGGPTPGPAPA